MQSSVQNNYASQFALLLFLFGTGLIAISLAFAGVTAIFHLKSEDLLEGSPLVARLSQSIGSLITLGLPAFVFARIVHPRQAFAYLRFSRRVSGKQVFQVIVIVFAAILVGGALSEINQHIPVPAKWVPKFKQLEEAYNKEIMVIAGMKSPGEYILSLVLLAFIPAVMEEMLFRGSLQQVMTGWTKNAFAGIFITSVLFSAVHASFYGFLPRLFLGMVLGYIYYYGNNIWLNIWAHFFNNALALTQVYSLSRAGKLTEDSVNDAMNDTFPLYLGLMAILVVVSALINFKRESMRLSATYQDQSSSQSNTDQ